MSQATSTAKSVSHEPTVFIVDDDDGMRSGVEFLLKTAGFKPKTFNSAEAFLKYFKPEMRGCVLLDVRMPGMSGLELQATLRERNIGIPVIILTAYADVSMAVKAMHNGAFEFFEKPFEGKHLIPRVKAAITHDADKSYDDSFKREVEAKLERLTPRELEVMELVASGILNKEAAAMLKISIKTVENHRARVMEKMEAEYLADLVRMAMVAGMV